MRPPVTCRDYNIKIGLYGDEEGGFFNRRDDFSRDY